MRTSGELRGVVRASAQSERCGLTVMRCVRSTYYIGGIINKSQKTGQKPASDSSGPRPHGAP